MQQVLLKGEWYHDVPVEEVQVGDFIEFFRHGYRVRRVQAVHLGCKNKLVHVEPLATENLKDGSVDFKNIRRVWRQVNGHGPGEAGIG